MALTTVVDKTIGDIFTEAMWDTYIKDNINELIGLRSRNLLTNGGFEVWQRGAGAFTASGAFTADRWQISVGAGSTLTITQETSIVDTASGSSLKAVYTHSTNGQIIQTVEDHKGQRGRTITLSLRLRQSAASGVVLQLTDGVTTQTSAASATTGSFVTLSVSLTVSASSTQLLGIAFITVAGTYYLDNAMLVMGPVAAEYVPLHPQEDLARCQRYYEVQGGVNSSFELRGYNAAATIDGNVVLFNTTKGGTPTMTKNGTWGVTNCGQPGVASPWVGGFGLYVTVTALGGYQAFANSTDDTIVAEYNP